MLLSNLTFSVEAVLGTNTPIAVSIDEKYVYENGEKTDKKYKAITVTSFESNLEKLTVKVQDCNLLLSNEAISARIQAMDFVRVNFTNDKVKIYTINGENRFSASADSVSLAENIADDTEINL